MCACISHTQRPGSCVGSILNLKTLLLCNSRFPHGKTFLVKRVPGTVKYISVSLASERCDFWENKTHQNLQLTSLKLAKLTTPYGSQKPSIATRETGQKALNNSSSKCRRKPTISRGSYKREKCIRYK